MISTETNTQPEINMKRLRLTDHAKLRLKEKFNMSDEVVALNFIKSNLGGAKYIGITTCELGEQSYMFTANKLAIYIALDLIAVKTIVKLNDTGSHYSGLINKINLLYKKEFGKIERLENSIIKKFNYIKVKSEMEIACLRYKKFKTRSKELKLECDRNIVDQLKLVSDYEAELKKVQTDKREIARAMSTVLVS